MEDYLVFEHKKELRFGSKVSLRSFFVNWAKRLNKGIKVVHKGEVMSLSVEELETKGTKNKKSRHVAMFSGQGIRAGETYYLIDYRFVPDGTVDTLKTKQDRLF